MAQCITVDDSVGLEGMSVHIYGMMCMHTGVYAYGCVCIRWLGVCRGTYANCMHAYGGCVYACM